MAYFSDHCQSPLPVGIEAVHVVDAGYVDPGTGITVPVPRAAEVVGRFEYAQSVPGAAQAVREVEAGNARADDDDVDVRLGRSVLAVSVII